jgi:hypothetical protein
MPIAGSVIPFDGPSQTLVDTDARLPVEPLARIGVIGGATVDANRLGSVKLDRLRSLTNDREDLFGAIDDLYMFGGTDIDR